MRGTVTQSLGRDPIREWLRAALERLGWTPARLGRESGVSPLAIRRALSSDAPPRLSIDDVRRISAATGSPLLIDPAGMAEAGAPFDHRRSDEPRFAAELTCVDFAPSNVQLRSLPIRDRVAAGRWRPVAPVVFQPLGSSPVIVDPESDTSRHWVEIVDDDSMGAAYQPGDRLHVAPYLEGDPGPRHGDHVIVERRRDGLVERTCREVVVTDEGLELVSRPREAAQEPTCEPIPFPATTGEEIQILGHVVGSYRPRRP